MEDQLEWQGLGRWLSFMFAGLMIILAIPGVFSHELGAASGWNLFLGLLMFGVVAAGHRKAPLLAIILSAIMALRVAIGAFVGPSWWILGDILMLAVIAAAAFDLRRQAAER